MSATPTNEQLNDLFAHKLDTTEGREKIAMLGGEFVKDRLREDAFCRMVFPPRKVKRSELQISMTHDTLVKIVFMEPQSRAMTMSFRGQPDSKYYRAERFEVPFYTIGSERYEKTEEELAVYSMPITEIIRKNVVRDIGEIEDYGFLTHSEAAVQSLQKEKNGVAFSTGFSDTLACTAFNVNAGTAIEHGKIKANDVLATTAAATAAAGITEELVVPCQKDDFIKLFKTFVGRGGQGSRLRCDSFLISDYDWEEINGWTISDVGDATAKETTVMGYKASTVIGRKYIKTIKTDILRPGNIYAYAAPEFVGGFLIWSNIKFYADKERNKVSFEAWENIGMYFANVAGVRKLELYAGSSDVTTGTSNAALLANFSPVDEDSLGAPNNLVADGQTFPQVSDF
mgnify:CR=1 FL=1